MCIRDRNAAEELRRYRIIANDDRTYCTRIRTPYYTRIPTTHTAHWLCLWPRQRLPPWCMPVDGSASELLQELAIGICRTIRSLIDRRPVDWEQSSTTWKGARYRRRDVFISNDGISELVVSRKQNACSLSKFIDSPFRFIFQYLLIQMSCRSWLPLKFWGVLTVCTLYV